MRIRARAGFCMGLLVLAGCASAPRSSSDACRADRITTRRGGFDTEHGFNWTPWDMGRSADSDGRLDVVESVEHCEHFVTVTQGERTWRSRGYRAIDRFVTDRHGRRWAFEGQRDQVFVVIDGTEGPPLREVRGMPTFSPSGKHVAYLAKDDQGGVVVLDGRVAMRAQEFHESNLAVLDDGRFGVVRSAQAPGTWEVAFDGWVSPAFDAILTRSFAIHEAKGRLAFVGARGEEYTAVIDGRPIQAPGRIVSGVIQFSNDGEHFAYGTFVPDDEERGFAVWDSRVIPLEGAGPVSRFSGAYPIFTTQSAMFPEETRVVVLGVPTPHVQPSVDDYQSKEIPARGMWRVRIGDSLGPRFDDLKLSSIEVLEGGRVKYVGTRNGLEIEVIDNRIPEAQRPAMGAP